MLLSTSPRAIKQVEDAKVAVLSHVNPMQVNLERRQYLRGLLMQVCTHGCTIKADSWLEGQKPNFESTWEAKGYP